MLKRRPLDGVILVLLLPPAIDLRLFLLLLLFLRLLRRIGLLFLRLAPFRLRLLGVGLLLNLGGRRLRENLGSG